MAAAGILTEEDDVELLEGWITPKMIHNPPHDLAVGLADEAIRRRLPEAWKVRTQSAIITADSRPEPDLVIVEGPLRRYAQLQPRPEEIALVIEIADTSLGRDRSKCRLYARAGIAVYWIVNLVDRQVEVYRAPNRDPDVSRYATRDTYVADQNVPLEIRGTLLSSIPVNDLLP